MTMGDWWSRRAPYTRETLVGVPVALGLYIAYAIVMAWLVSEPSIVWEIVGGVVGLACGVVGLLFGYWVEERRPL